MKEVREGAGANDPGMFPPCIVRESRRARKITLKISAGPRLEVVIPAGFDRGRLPGILAEKQDWIAEAMKRAREAKPAVGDSWCLPDEIHLQAVNRRVAVACRLQETGMIRLMVEGDSCIRITGEIHNEAAGRRVLHQWLQDQGERHLCPWLQRVSRETGLTFRRVQIRRQKTRWGSCSSRGTISLNQKLLFLPAHLVHYVMIHELCHTIHLNHSPAFWMMVARLEPGWKALDRTMAQAGKMVPAWAH